MSQVENNKNAIKIYLKCWKYLKSIDKIIKLSMENKIYISKKQTKNKCVKIIYILNW